jgi:solute carrier family 25 carnitine/acylcarnitine transporter 20/29
MDTIKVRMQISTQSFTSIVLNTFRNEGALAFYKGMELPLLIIPLVNACCFTVYEFSKRTLMSHDGNPMPYWKMYIECYIYIINIYSIICGMLSGSATAMISGPIELVKIRLQAQRTLVLSGPYEVIK